MKVASYAVPIHFHSHLEITFSLIAILFTTLTWFWTDFPSNMLFSYISPNFTFARKVFSVKALESHLSMRIVKDIHDSKHVPWNDHMVRSILHDI